MADTEVQNDEIMWLMAHRDDYDKWIDEVKSELFVEKNFAQFEQKIKKYQGKEKEEVEYTIAFYYSLSKGQNMSLFMEQYKKYLAKNPNEYYQSKICHYFMGTFKLNKNPNDFKSRNVFGQSAEDIMTRLMKKIELPLTKVYLGMEIESDERTMIEDYFLLSSKLSHITLKDGARVFFNRYPVTDLDMPRNRQLKFIETVAKRTRNLNNDINLIMREASDKLGNGGGFSQRKGLGADNLLMFDVSDHVKRDDVFYHVMFTLHHELGHADYYSNIDSADNEKKIRAAIENYLKHANPDFYKKYHDFFSAEQYAEEHAIATFCEEYRGNIVAEGVLARHAERLKEIRAKDATFESFLYSTYEKITGTSVAMVLPQKLLI